MQLAAGVQAGLHLSRTVAPPPCATTLPRGRCHCNSASGEPSPSWRCAPDIQRGRPNRRAVMRAIAALDAPAAPAAAAPGLTSKHAAEPFTATAAAAAAAVAPFLDPRPAIRDASGRLLLKNLTLQELTEWCASVGEPSPAKRAAQLYRGMYGKGRWVRSLDDADNYDQAFSKAFKAKVDSGASLSGGVSLQSVTSARDGTCKMVFALNGDEGGATGSVETVLIPMPSKQGLRYTACLSSQVGCAMNCQFCFTGRMGLQGNLSTAQIVEQVVEARRWLAEQGPEVSAPIANVVFMGMGEPLHNYDAVLAAVDILAEGLTLSRNKIIVSTVGLVPQMASFLQTGKAKLALSLHATTDEVRDWIVPTNRRYPIEQLMALLREHFPMYSGATRSPARGDNFIIIEYVMLRGVNDTLADAHRLAELLQEVYCMVNLIVFNPHDGTQFQRSDDEDVKAFRYALARAGKVCTIRVSKGDDSMAACGQLGDPGSVAKPAPILTPPVSMQAALAGAGARASANGTDSNTEQAVKACGCS